MAHRRGTDGRRGRPPLRCATAACAALALGAGLGTVPAQAQEGGFQGAKARVALSASLRTLSERVTASTCRTGLAAGGAAEEKHEAKAVFDVVMAGLRDGDASLGVPSAERDPRIKHRLRGVTEAWTEVRGAADKIGKDGTKALALIANTHDTLIDATEVLLADVSGHYSNPNELLQVDALALNILERERTLLTRMDRIVCAMRAGVDELGTAADLAETVGLFEASLTALRDGMPEAGVAAPRTKVLAATLTESHARWSEARPLLDAVVAGGPVDGATVDAVAELARTLSDDMQNAITLTKISSPGQADVYKVPLAAYAETALAAMLSDPALIAAIKNQNAAHAGLTQAEIDALDLTWRAEAKAGGGALVDDLMGRPVSLWLAEKQLQSAGFITEAFVMDDKGLNVAQSAVTSDYWQGDEAKWQETYADPEGGLHISEVEFDDSTGYYQTQASMPIMDPATGRKIGAVTFGINVQRLM